MINLHHASCLDWLADYDGPLFDSAVTDPPYHLSNISLSDIGKKATAYNRRNVHIPKTGFMGKGWDGGDIAFRPETWRAVYDALKPGAHLVAFSGTRTYHRMACAIEDAGFEIRDQLAWVYGSGFPKSMNVSKALEAHLTRGGSGTVQMRKAAMGDKYVESLAKGTFRNGTERGMNSVRTTPPAFESTTPEAAQWKGWGSALKPSLEPICLARKPLSEKSIAANVLKHGTGALNIDATRIKQEGPSPAADVYMLLSSRDSSAYTLDGEVVAPLDSLQRIAFALRSYSTGGTVRLHNAPQTDGNRLGEAECAQIAIHLFPSGGWCGLNLTLAQDFQSDCLLCRRLCDAHIHRLQMACQDGPASLADALVRICSERPGPEYSRDCQCSAHPSNSGDWLLSASFDALSNIYCTIYSSLPKVNGGRWPANLLLENCDEVLAGFPDTGAASVRKGTNDGSIWGSANSDYDERGTSDNGGSAARFFYQAKAGPLDRIGTAHATVKPVDVMRWLCRLVTPPGGHILEPFAGSGTTGIAAMAEGFDCTMIELEADHVVDIERKLAFLRGEGALKFQEHNHAKSLRTELQPLGGLFGEAA